jgi:hypothetical protein
VKKKSFYFHLFSLKRKREKKIASKEKRKRTPFKAPEDIIIYTFEGIIYHNI